jgi:predicted permease
MPDWKERLRKLLAEKKVSPAVAEDVAEELAQHLEMRYQEELAGGASPQAAEERVLREISGLAGRGELLSLRAAREKPVLEPAVDGGSAGYIGALWYDFRYACRRLRLSPGVAVAAILSLMLGIGANTAIFELLNALRLRTLPIAHPEQLTYVHLANMNGARGNYSSTEPLLTNAQWEQVRDQQQAFTGIGAWGEDRLDIAPQGEVRPVNAIEVSGELFNMLGVAPAAGRLFSAADDRPGCAGGVVLSNDFWRREYGGDPAAVGRTLTLEHHPFSIIGVAAAGFYGLNVGRSFDLAIPLCAEAVLGGQDSRVKSGTTWWLTVMGRLKPGVTTAQAASQLAAASPAIFDSTLPKHYPPVSIAGYRAMKLTAESAERGVSGLREQYTTSLLSLFAIASLVLLIACANLANLMLAQAGARQKEIAIRLALGASRLRLVRQSLSESLMLALLGAALGIVVAGVLSRFLVAFLSTRNSTLFLDLSPDGRVLAFTAGLSVLTCLLFGLMPALRSTAAAPALVLQGGTRATEAHDHFSHRRVLVAVQVALSVVLLATALLFSRSLSNLLRADAGFRQQGLYVVEMDLSHLKLDGAARAIYRRDLLERIRHVPGVVSASESWIRPLSGNAWGNRVWMDGQPEPPADGDGSLFNAVSGDYFRTLEVPLLAGRDFTPQDTAASQPVAIVNQAFAKKFVRGGSPIGQAFWQEATPGTPATRFEIVGLVKDTKYLNVRDQVEPIVYRAANQEKEPGNFHTVVLRSSLPPAGQFAGVRRELERVSSEIAFTSRVLRDDVEADLIRERLMATLSRFFAILALLLATVGLYGAMSYMAVRRTNEIGIRMALGATPWGVIVLVIREAALLLAFGLAAGITLTLASAQAIKSLLYGLSPHDPVAIASSCLLFTAVALLASYVPARRASKLDPMVALRET